MRIFFIVRYIPGGNLYKHLLDKKQFSVRVSRFYIAQVILALEHLHSKNIIYRDLKLENILVHDDGYIIISDFGLSKILSNEEQRCLTMCGTLEYLAPEMI